MIMKWRPPQFQKLSASSGPNLQIEKFTESIVFTALLTFGYGSFFDPGEVGGRQASRPNFSGLVLG